MTGKVFAFRILEEGIVSTLFHELILRMIESVCNVTQFMLNEAGLASTGVLTTIISNAATIATRKLLKMQTAVDDIYLFGIDQIIMDEEITATVTLLYHDKKYCKAEVLLSTEAGQKYKANLTLRVIKK